jgi:transcriptional regulator with XRE-family HTH domain
MAKPASTKVADLVSHHIDASQKPRYQIAEESGFVNPSMISMIKNGSMKVPLERAPKLAVALGLDPTQFLRRVLHEYTPEVLEVIEEYMGGLLSENERKMLELWRQATKESDPGFNTKTQENEFIRAVRDVML